MVEKKIAFIVQAPSKISPGQRFRFEQWEPLLVEQGFQINTFPFWGEKTYPFIHKKGYFLKKMGGLVSGYLRRLFVLFKLKRYDYIFLQREFAPWGPPLFEFITAKILSRKIIYDFDDAIWIPDNSLSNPLIKILKSYWKVKYICKLSYKVVCGNDYLCDYARKFNQRVVKIPTTVDIINRYHLNEPKENEGKLVIGWTGSHSTLIYLQMMINIINDLLARFDFEFLIIADRDPQLPIKKYRFVKWQEEEEINQLKQIDIGIMPLLLDEWSEGKCGFKIIQYFSVGIPAVASPVGVNKIIIEDGVNGFLCSHPNEWKEALSILLTNKELRNEMGIAGRKKVEMQFSLIAHKKNFLQLFSEA